MNKTETTWKINPRGLKFQVRNHAHMRKRNGMGKEKEVWPPWKCSHKSLQKKLKWHFLLSCLDLILLAWYKATTSSVICSHQVHISVGLTIRWEDHYPRWLEGYTCCLRTRMSWESPVVFPETRDTNSGFSQSKRQPTSTKVAEI